VPFLGELTQEPPLSTADHPGRGRIEARAYRRPANLGESGGPWGLSCRDPYMKYMGGHGVAPNWALLVVSIRDGADQ
jgi:hypothetical protein